MQIRRGRPWPLANRSGDPPQPADAERALADLELKARQRNVSPVLLALDHAHLGRHQRALDYLERAHTERDAYLVFVNVSPWFDPLRALPRFQRLRDRLKFPLP